MGGAKGTRTPDPHTASVVRYQLRHSPVFVNARPVKSVPSAKAKLHHARIWNQIRSSPVDRDMLISVAAALPNAPLTSRTGCQTNRSS